ncbi:MAG: putative transcriptional regulator [Rhodobacteraceae bacterium HLUCCA08]|nr:MAG: putative transcriptional regulator [Rhodobacteraceae bacterium HLUCCA08]
MTAHATDLTGQLLIAMPGMGDPRFDHSVVYLCAHSDEGAMGLIVNKPTPDVRFADLLEQLSIPIGDDARDIRVHYGGPVESGRGFVLHSGDYESGNGTMRVTDRVALTATLDVLEDLAQGDGPERSLLALGYSGWGPGQLEDEFQRNGWLTCDARDDILFGRANEHKWTAALKVLGIDPLLLSAEGGRA